MAAQLTELRSRLLPQLGIEVFGRGRSEVVRQEAGPAPKTVGHASDDELAENVETTANGAEDTPVAGDDITDLLRACLVALHLPPHVETYQPRALPFWSISDAANRMTGLLATWPEGAELGAFLPDIARVSIDRVLHARAAVAATLMATLELSRIGAGVHGDCGLARRLHSRSHQRVVDLHDGERTVRGVGPVQPEYSIAGQHRSHPGPWPIHSGSGRTPAPGSPCTMAA